MQKYKFENLKKEPHQIHSFEQIGMQDPFPEENWMNKKFVKPKYDTMVYDRKRLKANESPFCVFIPSRTIMFKIMRACVEVYEK